MASLDICVEGLLQLGGHKIFGVALEEVEGGRGGGGYWTNVRGELLVPLFWM